VLLWSLRVQRTRIDGELREQEEAAGELGSPASVAGASSCKRALADEEATVVQICGTDVDGVWWRRPATASREGGEGKVELRRKRT
jgi:hypothetical protein